MGSSRGRGERTNGHVTSQSDSPRTRNAVMVEGWITITTGHLLDTNGAWAGYDGGTGCRRPSCLDIVVHRPRCRRTSTSPRRGSQACTMLCATRREAKDLVPSSLHRTTDRPLVFCSVLASRTQQDESWWQPAWCWLASSTDEVAYSDVFEAGECDSPQRRRPAELGRSGFEPTTRLKHLSLSIDTVVALTSTHPSNRPIRCSA